MLKRVGAVTGDRVELLGGATVTVNGVRLLTRPIESLESPHVAFGSYVVADGKLWLFGSPGARSWNSRHFGPVPVASVRRVARPVLTVE